MDAIVIKSDTDIFMNLHSQQKTILLCIMSINMTENTIICKANYTFQNFNCYAYLICIWSDNVGFNSVIAEISFRTNVN